MAKTICQTDGIDLDGDYRFAKCVHMTGPKCNPSTLTLLIVRKSERTSLVVLKKDLPIGRNTLHEEN